MRYRHRVFTTLTVAYVALGSAVGCTGAGSASRTAASTSQTSTVSSVSSVATVTVTASASPSRIEGTAVRPTAATVTPTPLPPLDHSQVKLALSRLTGSSRRTKVVTVPGGYEAASYDNHGHIKFWHFADRMWAKVGASTYPYGQTGSTYPKFQAAVLTGMRHATYIADGQFSGDSSVNTAAYTDGPAGWGAIKARINGHAVPGGGVESSGQGVGYSQVGLDWADYFVDGRLKITDCYSAFDLSSFATAACEPRETDRRVYKWTGKRFAVTATTLAWSPSFCLSPKGALRLLNTSEPGSDATYPKGQPITDSYLCEMGWAAANIVYPGGTGDHSGAEGGNGFLRYYHDHWSTADYKSACGDMSARLEIFAGCSGN